jgi:hypothetical protein
VYGPVLVNVPGSFIEVEKQKFATGKIVTTRLRRVSEVALFVCTAGSGISEKSRYCTNLGDMVKGYVFDTVGSVAVEKAMDKIQELLQTNVARKGLNVSDRFSPGYCNWSVSDQQKLFSLLPAGFCGVTLSPSSLMNPIKSVSGIIGIGKDIRQKGYQCNWCNDENCIYGRIKRRKKELKN